MLNAIIYWSLRHRFLVIAIAVGFAVTGAFSLSRLATVVIGSVLTSTMLTLLVLPVFYALLGRKKSF